MTEKPTDAPRPTTQRLLKLAGMTASTNAKVIGKTCIRIPFVRKDGQYRPSFRGTTSHYLPF